MGTHGGTGPRVAVATCLSEVLECWGLLYESYRQAGYVPANAYGLHTVAPAARPEALVLAARHNGATVSTITAMGDTPEAGLPLDTVYPEELRVWRTRGWKLMEVGLFGCRDEKASLCTVFDLLRYTFFFGMAQGATDLICGIPPRRIPLYRRMLGFELVGEIKSYALVENNPVALMHGNIAAMVRDNKAYRAVEYAMRHPVAAGEFEGRYRFPGEVVRESRLGAYLAEKAAVAAEVARVA